MRTVLAVLAAIIIVIFILLGLYQCGPLGGGNRIDDGRLSELNTLQSDPMQQAVYDDDSVDITAPDYQTMRLPEAERLQLESDARDYITDLSEPTGTALDPSSAAQFVGAEQTFSINGETVTLGDLIAGRVNDANADGSGAGAGAQGSSAGRGGAGSTDSAGLSSAQTGSLYYVHTVLPTDGQGVWGIVQAGLKDKFARGLGLQRGEEAEVYRVDIPDNADEKQGVLSSFLGKVLHYKVRESLVFNRQNGSLGRNPDVIFPGQELVIIEFKPKELIAIYEYFITEGQQ